MQKRQRDQEEAQGLATKRLKSDQSQQRAAIEEIHFARQLQQLLSFRQDSLQQLRSGLASFKAFLEGISYHKDEDNRARQLSILREFLDSQRPTDIEDADRPFLSQIWQAWSFASQNHNDHISSSISAVLALLLKTLSSLLDFRELGSLLGRTVLQSQHLRLVKRCLDAPKHKDFLISPCLRLLIEVAGFDGGVLVKEVYQRREQTFDVSTLRRNLGLVRADTTEEEARRRPAIRTLTVRYILTLTKYLHEGGKVDLLKNRPLCTSLFHFLQNDPPDVVNEILSATEQYVLKDNDLPRSAKAALLVQHNLERVVQIATRSQNGHTAAERAFAWLKAVCTNPSYGVLRTSGWYPPGTTKQDDGEGNDSMIDLGLDSVEFFDRDERPHLRNTTLLSWIQTLRPHSNVQERELILTCFKSAPELVAAFFAEKTMQLEPKLSNTWVGYASFLFEVIRLPAPTYLGNETEWAELPPQTTIMIESILPRPLTQKVLTRCLNQSSELITFFAIRLLTLALEKLSTIQTQISRAAKSPDNRRQLWIEEFQRLEAKFLERCPLMKDIIGTFRKIPEDDEHALQREAATRLLRLFYDVLPLQAMEEQFDISFALTAALTQSEVEEGPSEVRELRMLELEHLLSIARNSPGMRWFNKQGNLDFSPIVTLLKIHAKDSGNRKIRQLIHHVLSLNNILNSMSACDALVAVLGGSDGFTAIGPFLDDCFNRAARQAVKYLDSIESLIPETWQAGDHSGDGEQPLSNLVAVFLEQAPFVISKPETVKSELETLISHYVELLMYSNERSAVLEAVQHVLVHRHGFSAKSNYSDPEAILDKVRVPERAATDTAEHREVVDEETAIPFSSPPVESDNHPELYKWARKDLDIAVDDGDVDAVILCLCSQYPDIRKQVLSQLHKLEENLLNSTLENKDPMYILVGELIETYEHHCVPKSEALPYLAGCFATHALRVQTEPAHFMYPKVNKFLNKGPEWRIRKMPSYWIENTVLSLPEEDDAYWKEAQWVLDWLIDGLRTSSDLEILRRTGVFEKVMSLCSSPGLGAQKNGVKEKVLELIWRATYIDGGSTMLITRTGVLGWLDMMKRGEKSLENMVKKRVIETCDRARVEEWSGLRPDEL